MIEERERERKAGLAFVKRCTQRLNRSLPGPSRETRLPINNRLLPRRMLDEEIEALTTPRSREGKKEKKEGKRRREGGGERGRRCTRDARGPPHLGSISHSNGLINRLTPPITVATTESGSCLLCQPLPTNESEP